MTDEDKTTKAATAPRGKITRQERSRIAQVLRVIGDTSDSRIADDRLIGLGVETAQGTFTYIGGGLMKGNAGGGIVDVKPRMIRGFFEGSKPKVVPIPLKSTSPTVAQLEQQAAEQHATAVAAAKEEEESNKASLKARGITEKQQLLNAIGLKLEAANCVLDPLALLDQALGINENKPLDAVDQLLIDMKAAQDAQVPVVDEPAAASLEAELGIPEVGGEEPKKQSKW